MWCWAQIREMVAAYEGDIAESNRWLVNEQPRARVTMRIPADRLDEALDSLRSAAIRVESESSSGQDVTEEYYDVDARLRNLEATEKELLALLTEVRENRGKAEDILAIYRELTSIRAQIESLQGRKQYLSQMSALATINVEIAPKGQPVTVLQREVNLLVTATAAAVVCAGLSVGRCADLHPDLFGVPAGAGRHSLAGDPCYPQAPGQASQGRLSQPDGDCRGRPGRPLGISSARAPRARERRRPRPASTAGRRIARRRARCGSTPGSRR